MPYSLLVTETDKTGKIIALWHAGKGLNSARPVTDPAKALRQLPDADISGATRPEIEAWLRDS